MINFVILNHKITDKFNQFTKKSFYCFFQQIIINIHMNKCPENLLEWENFMSQKKASSHQWWVLRVLRALMKIKINY